MKLYKQYGFFVVDIWSMGVIIIELFENDPPFDPDSEIRALHMIFQAFGTPSKEMWEEIVHLRHYSEVFPKWKPRSWKEVAKHAPDVAVDLLKRMFLYNPQDRITCRDAMQHSYFDTEHGPDLRTPDPNEPPLPPKFLSPKHMFVPRSDADDNHIIRSHDADSSNNE
ncbi:cyclin-dependent kinase 1-like [Paramacrobiotus metropolitanus]|uniref:cyclin-dependent kinase 1-like n=1 Tax=Paramacrobiotus metropolitanus TaxID=2943436 RepID=UPI002446328F|nr:cyclin-dependent kinase 1-like [Paramacrobiotus metropolitanus]